MGRQVPGLKAHNREHGISEEQRRKLRTALKTIDEVREAIGEAAVRIGTPAAKFFNGCFHATRTAIYLLVHGPEGEFK